MHGYLTGNIGGTTGDIGINRLHTHITELQRSLLNRNLKGVITIGIGNGTYTGLTDTYGHSYQQFTVVVTHMTADSTLATAQLLLADGNDVAFDRILTTYHFDNLLHNFFSWFFCQFDSDTWPLLGQISAVEEV